MLVTCKLYRAAGVIFVVCQTTLLVIDLNDEDEVLSRCKGSAFSLCRAVSLASLLNLVLEGARVRRYLVRLSSLVLHVTISVDKLRLSMLSSIEKHSPASILLSIHGCEVSTNIAKRSTFGRCLVRLEQVLVQDGIASIATFSPLWPTRVINSTSITKTKARA